MGVAADLTVHMELVGFHSFLFLFLEYRTIPAGVCGTLCEYKNVQVLQRESLITHPIGPPNLHRTQALMFDNWLCITHRLHLLAAINSVITTPNCPVEKHTISNRPACTPDTDNSTYYLAMCVLKSASVHRALPAAVVSILYSHIYGPGVSAFARK